MSLSAWASHNKYKKYKKAAYNPGYADETKRLSGSQKLLSIVCLLLPPLAVALHTGINHHFWIDVVLTILGFIPGVVYGVIIILTHHPSTYNAKKSESFDR